MASYKIVIKKSAAKELQEIAGKKDRQRLVTRINETVNVVKIGD